MRKFIIFVLMILGVCLATGCEEKFEIIDVSPSFGVLGGGEPVVIHGTGFNQNLGISVFFGNTKSENVVVVASNKLTVMTPSVGEPTVVDIRIATDDGKEFVIKRAFRYNETSTMDIRDLGARKSKRKKTQ